jgi:hypothetical protein
MTREERLMKSSIYVDDTDMWGNKLVKYVDFIDEIHSIYDDFESEIEQIRNEAQARIDSFCQLNNAVTMAFDEVQSRTCINCKFYSKGKYPDDCYCDKGVSLDEDFNLLEDNFYCNKWESKDDT